MVIARTRAPERCLVGPGAAADVGGEAAPLGRKALVMGGARAIDAAGPALFPSLDAAGVAHHVEQGGHVQKTRASVDRLVAAGKALRCDVVIACGGGAVMDCAKAVAHELPAPLINVPTIAATNACGTPGANIDGDAGPRPAFRGARVIVADTAVIAAAGARYLASGMADAVSAWPGASLALRQGAPAQQGISATRLAVARLCTETILNDGAAAFAACERGEATPEVDRVAEAIVYCSGLARFGVPGDHQLHPAGLPGARTDLTHGEWVGYGLLTRLLLGGELPEELAALCRFFPRVNLATRLAHLGLEGVSPEALLEEARRVTAPTTAGALAFGMAAAPAPEAVRDAWLRVDRLGRSQ